MDYYAGASKAYTAQQQATAALIGAVADTASGLAGAGAFAGGGGSAATGSMQGPTGFTPSNYSSGLGNDARMGFAPQ
jgi:hypothetical protein